MLKNSNKIGKIEKREITAELQESYLDYAMSVIVSRALPDVRDGLKPVQRRILWTMLEDGLTHSAKFRKSANVVGQAMSRYHPHGDAAIYDTLVRMAQDFSLRYPLIQGQGNFGSQDGDSAAAYRYCVTGNTLLITDKGLQAIQEVSEEDPFSRAEEKEINIRVLSKNQIINTASRWFNSGVHPILKIITWNGYEISGSYNHPLLTLQKHPVLGPVFVWKTLREIAFGDILVMDRSENILWPKQLLELKKYYPAKSSHILPQYLDEDLAFILGAFVSEGSVSKTKIEFCNTDPDLINDILSRWQKIFPDSRLHKFKRQPSSFGKRPYIRLECHCRDTNAFLNNLGLTIVRSDSKTIPPVILRSPKRVVSSFLRALYEGNGGTVNNRKRFDLFYCSSSKHIVKHLQILLLRFGIASSRRYDKSRNLHNVFIRGRSNLVKFQSEIGFFSSRKNGKLALYLGLPKKEFSATDFIPFLSDFIRSRVGYSEFILKNNFDHYPRLAKNGTQVIAITKQKTGLELNGILKSFLETHYLFEQVAEIKKCIPQRVYSLRVDSACHSFVANGFINHNTEARLSKIADELLSDIEKETVDWQPNYDASRQEPKVLPAKLPNLLLNGSMGIAVGMATNIPPHNLSEIADATLYLIDNPKAGGEDLMRFIQGPDFPTGGIIYNKKTIDEAYTSGRGPITVRAKTEIAEKKEGRFSIVVTEIPYQVNKAELIVKIAELVQDKKVEGIRDVRDESSKEGVRIVIDLKNDASPQKILNQLYKHTDLQKDFHMNMLALSQGIQPQTMSVKDVLQAHIEHRREVVRRRTEFELREAKERTHILEGLAKALSVIDKIISVIKKSKNSEEARQNLVKNFKLTDIQATAILEMKLRTLAALERQKIEDELKEKRKLIKELEIILKNEKELFKIIKNELVELKKNYGDERRTKLVAGGLKEFQEEDLVPQEEVVIALSQSGYIKRVAPTSFKAQRRGGKGLIGSELGEEDFVSHFISANTHDNILFFTDRGKVFQTKVYEIPVGSRTAKGKLIQNFLDIPTDENINAIVAYSTNSQQPTTNNYLAMATQGGIIKKTPLRDFASVRRNGIIAVNLAKDDKLKWAGLTSGKDEIILTTALGQAIRFKESQLRPMGRTASGVKAIKLRQNDFVAGMDIIKEDLRFKIKDLRLLVVTENGFTKQTTLKEYKIQSRGGQGIKTAKITGKTGLIVASRVIADEEEILALSAKGQILRTKISDIRIAGRATSGVRIMKLKQGDKVAGIVCL